MTAQISDHVFYRGQAHALTAVNSPGLFDPSEHGLEPVSPHTACWRGYVCGYAVQKDRLVLDELSLSIATEPPVLFGRSPSGHDLSGHVYRSMRHPVEYTGGMLLARDFIRDLYVHMGFHPAWKYRIVHELHFDQGRVTYEADCSGAVEALRTHLTREGRWSTRGDRDPELLNLMNRCFRQGYRL